MATEKSSRNYKTNLKNLEALTLSLKKRAGSGESQCSGFFIFGGRGMVKQSEKILKETINLIKFRPAFAGLGFKKIPLSVIRKILIDLEKTAPIKGLTCLFILFALCFNLYAQEPVNVEKLANAIYKAENSKSHPYGILAHYKHTTPRQACINTIKHALRDFKGEGDFISFLGSRYCPIGASNDPRGLNKNWVNNVKHFYKRG